MGLNWKKKTQITLVQSVLVARSTEAVVGDSKYLEQPALKCLAKCSSMRRTIHHLKLMGGDGHKYISYNCSDRKTVSVHGFSYRYSIILKQKFLIGAIFLKMTVINSKQLMRKQSCICSCFELK